MARFDTLEVHDLVTRAIEVEGREGHLARLVADRARVGGRELAPREQDEVVDFLREYVEHAPALLDQMRLVAVQEGLTDKVEPLVEAAGAYFLAPLDVIPDRLGLLGLLDDAYLTHRLVERCHEAHRAATGRGILPDGLDQANGMVREVIGEPRASLLDSAVDDAMRDPKLRRVLDGLIQAGTFRVLGPDPIWGTAHPGERAASRLGAWGVLD